MSQATERLLTVGLAAAVALVGSVLLLPPGHALRPEPSPYLAGFAAIKMLGQGLGAWLAILCVRAFPAGDPMRRAWGLLAAGMVGLLVGQTVLAHYQFVRGVAAPFPSAADLFFVPAMLCLLGALAGFARAQASSGLALATPVQLRRAGGLGVIVAGVVGVVTLVPVLQVEAPMAERLLNLAYPVFDLAMIVPLALLLRMTWALRGGAVFGVWLLIGLGVCAMVVGDTAYAYFTTLKLAWLDPVLDLGFAVAYLCIAWGTSRQAGMLRGS